MADPAAEHGVREAIERLHTAMNRVVAGDVSAIKALYSHRDDVSAFYGWGGYQTGWEAVSRRWDWAARQFKAGGQVSYEPLTTIVTAELAYTTAIETIQSGLAGVTGPAQWSNRVTHVFRLEAGEWRLVHRHANRLEAQYEPSTRLG
ncbi:MAG TPA: nuclear transport factor 2 family protein [Methylomirabilota bacterium]|jgi:ketosteroid isomerase-like protein|nr:nuclear transport factor 2 family protein [Methylomirabilota bacterium]